MIYSLFFSWASLDDIGARVWVALLALDHFENSWEHKILLFQSLFGWAKKHAVFLFIYIEFSLPSALQLALSLDRYVYVLVWV